MTGRDLLTGALRTLGVLSTGESLSASDASDGLQTLNDLIDSFSNERLLIHTVTEEAELTLTAGQGSYTLGTGGDITTRPQSIDGALIRDDSASPAIDYPLHMLTDAEWQRITQKDTESTIPTEIHIDGGYPLRTAHLYPVPSASKKLVLYTLRPLTRIATLDTELSLPPGYARMLKFNVVLDLAPEYGRQVDAMTLKAAQESKEVIKRQNHRLRLLRTDPALQMSRGFNIYTGDYNR